ncbi:MAG: hypothetical protein JWN07_423 [Hyphomicrobiales bacterium]|nr:hypothetical protein [Hyphomicrobiales bacterium]
MTHGSLTRDEIIALEKSYWEAMKAKDGARAASLSGEVSLVTGARGVSRIARDTMQKMTEDDDWILESYAFDAVEVSSPAPDVAIIAYTVRQTVTVKGESQDLHAADMSTWVRTGEAWVCHAHSETLLKD